MCEAESVFAGFGTPTSMSVLCVQGLLWSERELCPRATSLRSPIKTQPCVEFSMLTLMWLGSGGLWVQAMGPVSAYPVCCLVAETAHLVEGSRYAEESEGSRYANKGKLVDSLGQVGVMRGRQLIQSFPAWHRSPLCSCDLCSQKL